MIVGGMIIMTCGLLLVGGISTINTKPGLSATVAFMCVWGFLVCLNLHNAQSDHLLPNQCSVANVLTGMTVSSYPRCRGLRCWW